MTAAMVMAVVPIALLIGLGHALKRGALLSDTFWPAAERLSYVVLLPALFVHSIATADLDGVPLARLAGALVASTLAVALLLVLTQRVRPLPGPAFTSVFQGGIRFNNYVGVTAASALFGPSALGLAAVANAAVVPTVNVLVVLAFARHGSAKPTPTGLLRNLAFNPLILGCAGGMALNISGLGLPPGLEGAVRALGQASMPLGLLCVGAAVDWKVVGRAPGLTLGSSAVKFALLPLATALACLAFGLDGEVAMVAILFQALPTASSAYVMARQLGGDAPLMAAIVAMQTVLALLALPLVFLAAGLVFTI